MESNRASESGYRSNVLLGLEIVSIRYHLQKCVLLYITFYSLSAAVVLGCFRIDPRHANLRVSVSPRVVVGLSHESSRGAVQYENRLMSTQ